MDEAAVRVFWSPSPPSHAVTCVTACETGWVYTGGSDGAIVRWQLNTVAPPKACVMLMGHTRTIRHLAAGLRGDDGARYLLSVDDGGGCCLWLEPCGRCVARRQVPELAGAVFAEVPPPPPNLGEPRTAGWLLAAVPLAPSHLHPEPPSPPPPPLQPQHPPSGGARSAGPLCGASESSSSSAAACCPVLWVLDWRSLNVVHVLHMQPLQQLVCVDGSAVALRFSGGGGRDVGGHSNSGGGGTAGDSSPMSGQPLLWAEAGGGGGGSSSTGSTAPLLCLRWSYRATLAEAEAAAPPERAQRGPQEPLGSCTAGPRAESSCGSSAAAAAGSVALAAAVTPMGTLYGCVVPYDLYKPPAWVLGRGGSAMVGDSNGGDAWEAGFYGDEAASAVAVWEDEAPQELRGQLLAAALSSDLRWALLGAVDAWVVMEARWCAVQPTVAAAARGGDSDGGTATIHQPPGLLRMSYITKCRISLMHQTGRMVAALQRPSRRPQAVAGGGGGGAATTDSRSSCSTVSDSQLTNEEAGRSPLLQAARQAQSQQRPDAIRSAAQLLLLDCWEPETDPLSQWQPEPEPAAPSAELASKQGFQPLHAAVGELPVSFLRARQQHHQQYQRNGGTAATRARLEPSAPVASNVTAPVDLCGGSDGKANAHADAGEGAAAAIVGVVEGLAADSGLVADLSRLTFAVYPPHQSSDGGGDGEVVSSCFCSDRRLQLQQQHVKQQQQQRQQRPLLPQSSPQQLHSGKGPSPLRYGENAVPPPPAAAAAAAVHPHPYQHRHRHHRGGHPDHAAPAVLQALSWDGAGHQQLVALTADGRVLAVRELSAAAPRAARSGGGAAAAAANISIRRGFCCHLPAREARGGGLAMGWVLGVHCYPLVGNGQPTASVLQWPLRAPPRRPQRQWLRGSAAAAASEPTAVTEDVRAAAATEMGFGCREEEGRQEMAPLIGSLHDGWLCATWHAHASRRRRVSHASGRALGGGCSGAVEPSTHGSVWVNSCQRGGGGGERGGGSERGSLESSGNDGGGGNDDDVVRDSDADQARRRISGMHGTKRPCSGNGFVQFASVTPDAAGDGVTAGGGLYGSAPSVASASATAADQTRNGRSRRRDSAGGSGAGGGGGDGVPACLCERWDAVRRWSCSSCSSSLSLRSGVERRAHGPWRDPLADGSDVDLVAPAAAAAMAAACSTGGDGAVAVASGGSPVVSTSVVMCDGTANGEAVVLHCTADGAMHYCDAGAYAVPAVRLLAGRQWWPPPTTTTTAARRSGSTPPGGVAGFGAQPRRSSGGGGTSETETETEADEPAAALCPRRAGSMYGHIGPVTCQLEVAVTTTAGTAARAAAAAAAPAAASPSPLASPSPPASPVNSHPHASVTAAAAAAVAAIGGVVRVLLTGGADGSLRAWHTHAAAFGRPVFALRPHGGPVRRVLLPRWAGGLESASSSGASSYSSAAAVPPEFRHCVASVAEDGSVALVCMERGCVVRVCRSYPYGMPEVVSWTFRRGFLACGGRDPAGRWAVAVFDLAPQSPSLDRLAVGPEAAALLGEEAVPAAAAAAAVPYSPSGHTPIAAVPADAEQAHLLHLHPYQMQHHSLPPPPRYHQQRQRHSHLQHFLNQPHHRHHHDHHTQQQQQAQQQFSQQQWQALMRLPLQDGAGNAPPGISSTRSTAGAAQGHGYSLGALATRPICAPAAESGSGSSSLPPPSWPPAPASLPHAAALIAASSSAPRLAPTWVYGGSFRTMYCHRPDVVLAAIDGEALLGLLAAADAAAAATAATNSGGGSGSCAVAMPRRPPTRGGPGLPSVGSVPTGSPGALSPTTASPSQPSISPCPSRERSLDSTAKAAGAAAATGAESRDHSPVALASAAARASRGRVTSRFSFEADRSVGGGSSAADEIGSRRLSLDEPPLVDGGSGGGGSAAAGATGDRALAALISVLHSWTSDPHVDRALEAALRGVGILEMNRRRDPGIGDGAAAGGGAAAVQMTAAARRGSTVNSHRAHSAPPGQTCCGQVGPSGQRQQACGLLGRGASAASRGGSADAAAALVAGPSVGCSPRQHTPLEAPDRDPELGGEGRGELYGHPAGAGRRTCLVQPALVSACGAVALALPQAAERRPADPWIVGDPTAAAARLLHIVALAGALGGYGTGGGSGGSDCTTSRAAMRAASHVRHLCLVTARDAVAAERAAAATATEISCGSIPGGAIAAGACAAASATATGPASLGCTTVRSSHVFPRGAAAPGLPPLLEPDLAVFACRWLAADPRVREAAQLLLSSYAKPVAPPPRAEGAAAAATAPLQPAAPADGTTASSAAPPLPALLSAQVTELLRLRGNAASKGGKAAALSYPVALQSRRRPSGYALSPPPPPPQQLYPAAVVAAATCLAHPDEVPRQLLAAAATSLGEWLYLPLTLPNVAALAAPATDVLPAAHGRVSGGGGGAAGPLPQHQQQHQRQNQHGGGGGGLWAEGRVLLPEVAAAMLTAALRGPRAQLWRQQLQPWPHFVDRLLHLAHAIPLPTSGAKGPSYNVPASYDAASSPPTWPALAAVGGGSMRGLGPEGHYGPTSPPPLASAATAVAAPAAQRAARQLASQVVGLLAAVAVLDMEGLLEGLARFAGGDPLPLHPLTAAALTRLAASRAGRCRLAAAAPALGALLAGCAAAPAARGRPDLARPAYLAAADLAAVLPCAALHGPTLQLAVARPLAAACPSGDPLYVTVYDLEYGNVTWHLPLQPGPEALHPLLPDVAAALATAPPSQAAASASAAAASGSGAAGSGAAAAAKAVPYPPPAAALPGLLRGLGQAGVAALQFSPQGDHLALLLLDGAPLPTLLVYRLTLPWAHKLLSNLSGATPRPALVLQPCHCWLLPPGLAGPQLGPGPADAYAGLGHGTPRAHPSEQQQQPPAASGRLTTAAGAKKAVAGAEAAAGHAQQQQQCSSLMRSKFGAAAAAAQQSMPPVWGPGQGQGVRAGAAVGEPDAGPPDQAQAQQQQGVRQQGQAQERQREQRQGGSDGCCEEGGRDSRLAWVVGERPLGLRWSGPRCVELLRSRTGLLLARFVLPGQG